MKCGGGLPVSLVAIVFIDFAFVPPPLLFCWQGSELSSFSREDMLEAKQLGYSDIQISQRVGATGDEVSHSFYRSALKKI